MRVALFGTRPGPPHLKALLRFLHEVVLVVTHPRAPTPTRRSGPISVADLATTTNVPVLLRNRPDDLLIPKEADPDIIVANQLAHLAAARGLQPPQPRTERARRCCRLRGFSP